MEIHSCNYMKPMYIIPIFITLSSFFILPCLSFDPKNPPKIVKEVCNRSGHDYSRCITVFNTGAVENGDMRFLSYYTRDFAENSCNEAINRIKTSLIPSEPDQYSQQVLGVCLDAFSQVKDELSRRVNAMIVSNNEFKEAEAWVRYAIGLMKSCNAVCEGKPTEHCPLLDNVQYTEGMLKLLSTVLELLNEGIM